MSGHYLPVRWTARHVLFTSRWGELLIYDRVTRKSLYQHSDISGPDCDKLERLATDDLFDAFASEYVQCGGQDIAEPLPPSVLDWFLAREGDQIGGLTHE